jgi:hypothetical protein
MAAVKSSDEDIRRGFRKRQAKACVEKGHAVSPRRGFTQAANLHIEKKVTVTVLPGQPGGFFLRRGNCWPIQVQKIFHFFSIFGKALEHLCAIYRRRFYEN